MWISQTPSDTCSQISNIGGFVSEVVMIRVIVSGIICGSPYCNNNSNSKSSSN